MRGNKSRFRHCIRGVRPCIDYTVIVYKRVAKKLCPGDRATRQPSLKIFLKIFQKILNKQENNNILCSPVVFVFIEEENGILKMSLLKWRLRPFFMSYHAPNVIRKMCVILLLIHKTTNRLPPEPPEPQFVPRAVFVAIGSEVFSM